MRPVEVSVKAEVRGLLPEADFADAFSLTLDDPSVDAATFATRAIVRPPGWIATLMQLRDAIVRPLGLRTGDDASLAHLDRIGVFPVLSRTPERVASALTTNTWTSASPSTSPRSTRAAARSSQPRWCRPTTGSAGLIWG